MFPVILLVLLTFHFPCRTHTWFIDTLLHSVSSTSWIFCEGSKWIAVGSSQQNPRDQSPYFDNSGKNPIQVKWFCGFYEDLSTPPSAGRGRRKIEPLLPVFLFRHHRLNTSAPSWKGFSISEWGSDADQGIPSALPATHRTQYWCWGMPKEKTGEFSFPKYS